MKKSASTESKPTAPTRTRSTGSTGSAKRPRAVASDAAQRIPGSEQPGLSAPPNSPSQHPQARLEFFHPQAREIFVAGTFNDWNPGATPLCTKGGGNWSTDLTLAPGTYEYRFVVDGVWTDDPKSPRAVANPYGGVNSILQVDPSNSSERA